MFCTRACSSRRIDGETETKINKAKSSRELNCKSGAFEVRSALKLRQFQVKPLLAPLFGHNLGDPSLLPISLPEAEERGRKRTVLLSRVPKFRPVEFYWKESTLLGLIFLYTRREACDQEQKEPGIYYELFTWTHVCIFLYWCGIIDSIFYM